ncbi:MAG: c-type cytochrome [Pseudomonadota bacterium]
MKPQALWTLLLLTACVTEQEVVNGKARFAADCASCHGAVGTGGNITFAPGVTAPDLTQLTAQNGGIFPRAAVMATIDGLNRPAHFAAAMPEFGAGDLGEAVVVELEPGIGTPTPIGLIALADYLDSIQAR